MIDLEEHFETNKKIKRDYGTGFALPYGNCVIEINEEMEYLLEKNLDYW
jgi:hypothetical protein